MSPRLLRLVCLLTAFAVLQEVAVGGLISPPVGSQAQLSNLAHAVSGTVTIVDEDTVRVDDFTYDGGGPLVYFYLGAEEADEAFKTGLQIGMKLNGFGVSYDGTQGPLLVDLPSGETLEGYHAFSVWCVRGEANFGSGTFQAVAVPEPAGLSLVLFSLMLMRRPPSH